MGQIPLVPELRSGGDIGQPITVADPNSEASNVFDAMAEVIDVELAPTRRFNPGLKLLS